MGCGSFMQRLGRSLGARRYRCAGCDIEVDKVDAEPNSRCAFVSCLTVLVHTGHQCKSVYDQDGLSLADVWNAARGVSTASCDDHAVSQFCGQFCSVCFCYFWGMQ